MITIDHEVADRQASFAAAYKGAAAMAGGQCPIESGFAFGLADHECKHGRLATDKGEQCACWKTTPDLMTTLKPKRRKPKPKPDLLTSVLTSLDQEIERLTTARNELRKLAA